MYAQVLVEYEARALDKVFTYKIPSFLAAKIQRGMKVKVPFGPKNINGLILNITNNCDAALEIKEIFAILEEEIILNEELLLIGKKIQEQTLCSLTTAYKAMLPSRLKVNNNKEKLNKFNCYLKLNLSEHETKDFFAKIKSEKQKNILKRLLKKEIVLRKEVDPYSLKQLMKKKIVKLEKDQVYRLSYNQKLLAKRVLTLEQTKVFQNIVSVLDSYQTHLIFGITGSGKTEIYFNLIDEVLKLNKSALVLVPEITLTTQIISRFYERYGNLVAIYHSALSEGEKYDEYLKIYRGEVKIVVGTRSSVFVPLANLGLIIVDEEHSDNFKQDTNPRYNALDIAKYRSKYHHIPLVLGSATPSLESMSKALSKTYKFHILTKRVGESTLPDIHLVNMIDEVKKRNSILCTELQEKIKEVLTKKEQVILFLNRRGFSPYITCNNCGYTYKCKYCDISLTYHKSSNSLRCHYCGYTVLKPDLCPECHEQSLTYYGLGTEKLEEFMQKTFSQAKIIRMDTDTTSNKGMTEKLLNKFRNQEYDILIGTQMISKGLDFPRVTLVGVINADLSLNIPDFRSSERTFALLDQVAGRAGRSNLKGNVYIQTFNPDNYIFAAVQKHQYWQFYETEMTIRRKLKYPPFYFLTSLKIVSKDYESAKQEANKIYNYLNKTLKPDCFILGPTTASVFKVNNTYRFQIILKYKTNLNNILKDISLMYLNNKKVNLEIDNNPLRM